MKGPTVLTPTRSDLLEGLTSLYAELLAARATRTEHEIVNDIRNAQFLLGYENYRELR